MTTPTEEEIAEALRLADATVADPIPGDTLGWTRILAAALSASQAERDRYRKALEEVSIGAGPFSRDPLTHASNTIEAMKDIAKQALTGEKP